jgi:hypothetical protein
MAMTFPGSATAECASFLNDAPGMIGGAAEGGAVVGFDVITQAREVVIPAACAHLDAVQLQSQAVVTEMELGRLASIAVMVKTGRVAIQSGRKLHSSQPRKPVDASSPVTAFPSTYDLHRSGGNCLGSFGGQGLYISPNRDVVIAFTGTPRRDGSVSQLRC